MAGDLHRLPRFSDNNACADSLTLRAGVRRIVPRRNLSEDTSMKKALTMALGAAGILVAVQAAAQVTFYEREGFRGRSFNADREIGNLERFGFNDRAASVV